MAIHLQKYQDALQFPLPHKPNSTAISTDLNNVLCSGFRRKSNHLFESPNTSLKIRILQ